MTIKQEAAIESNVYVAVREIIYMHANLSLALSHTTTLDSYR